MNGFCRAKITTAITIDEAHFLTDGIADTIGSMQSGANDIMGIDMSPDVRRFLGNVQKALYGAKGDNCLRCVPEASLALLFSLRIGEHDGFTQAIFGHVISRDIPTAHPKMRTIKTRSREIELRSARRHLWASVEELEDILRIVRGIVDASRMMHHKSIINQDELIDLGQSLYRVWEDNGGYVKVHKLHQILQARLNEHAEAVHARIADASALVPSINSFPEGSGSAFLLEQAKHDAHLQGISKSASASPVENLLETAAGKRRFKHQGIDADGRLKEYKRSKKDTTQDEKELTAEQLAKITCLRCGEVGHKARGCKKPFCDIPPNWTEPQKKLAKRMREEAKVKVTIKERKSSRSSCDTHRKPIYDWHSRGNTCDHRRKNS